MEIDEIFEIIHQIQIEAGNPILKQTPKGNSHHTTPIWYKNIPKMEKKQIEHFYKNRTKAFRELMNLTRLPDGRYKLNLDFINYYADYFYVDNQSLSNRLPLQLFSKGSLGIVYVLYRDGLNFIVKQIPNVKLNLYLSLRVIELTKELCMRNESFYINSFRMKKKMYSSYLSYETKFEESRYCLRVESNNFTNQTLLHMIINEYLGDNPNYLYQYDSFYCLNGKNIDGYNITEFSNEGDLSKFIQKVILTEELIMDIMIQIMTPLFVLKHPMIGFLHSDIKPKNIFVNITPEGKIHFKLSDFDKSSIFYKNIRFHNDHYNYSIKKEFMGIINLNKTPFPLHTSDSYSYYSMNDTNLYGKVAGFHEFIMSNPEGFYSSFDIYTFFYSLILEPKIYEWMIGHPRSIIWEMYKYLFHYDEPIEWMKFENNIQSIYEKKISGDISSIKFFWKQFKINAFKLRYDINEIYNKLGINIQTIKGKIPESTYQLIQNYHLNQDILYISYDNHLCIVEPDITEDKCLTNVYSKISKDPRDLGYSYLYVEDSL